jgi:hypothetical protein
MIHGESRCDHRYLRAFRGCKRGKISSAMSQNRTSGAKALIAVAFLRHGLNAVPFVGLRPHQRKAVHVHQPKIRNLQMGDDGEGQKSQMQEWLR